MLALGDLCVEIGDDTGAPLVVPVSAIAEKFVIYYWRQALPYPVKGRSGTILKQNTGQQAAIVRLVAAATSATTGGSLAAAKASKMTWMQLVARIASRVETMPLWKLQRVGDDVLDFLYPNTGERGSIELRPGVAYCFRRFHSLVEDLVRGAWVRFVRDRRENQPLLGDMASLDEFLFGSERADLSVYVPILDKVQNGRCFYCDGRINAAAAVDHFIPWSRYPVDFAHNFVLAHQTCNAKKGDRLAAVEHLERWCQRNDKGGKVLDEAFSGASIFADRTTSTRITRWAYEQIEVNAGLVWADGEKMVPLDPRWRAVLEVVA